MELVFGVEKRDIEHMNALIIKKEPIEGQKINIEQQTSMRWMHIHHIHKK